MGFLMNVCLNTFKIYPTMLSSLFVWGFGSPHLMDAAAGTFARGSLPSPCLSKVLWPQDGKCWWSLPMWGDATSLGTKASMQALQPEWSTAIPWCQGDLAAGRELCPCPASTRALNGLVFPLEPDSLGAAGPFAAARDVILLSLLVSLGCPWQSAACDGGRHLKTTTTFLKALG